MRYTIYASQSEEVQKRLERLAKKAARYSVPFAYSIGDEHPETVRVMDYDPVNHCQFVANRYTVAAVDVEIECDGFIKANGWTIRAKVEHGEGGNIVTGIGQGEIRPEWYTAAPRCEHCNTARPRSITYFCENEAGEIRQVGRTCLHDYTGISPATATMWAEVQDIFSAGMDCSPEEWEGRRSGLMFSVDKVIAHACDSIREYGYRKSSDLGSTREKVTALVENGSEPTPVAVEEAGRIMAWVSSLDAVVRKEDQERRDAWNEGRARAIADGYTAEDFDNDVYCDISSRYVHDVPSKVGDLERNCIPMVLSGYAKPHHFGRLVYLPLAYKKYLERKAREERREAERVAAAATSAYVGSVGERITVKMATAVLVTSWENAYGMTFLYKFTDEHGNVYIWYASRSIQASDGMTIKATVKDHNERDGVKQTVITRCKAA